MKRSLVCLILILSLSQALPTNDPNADQETPNQSLESLKVDQGTQKKFGWAFKAIELIGDQIKRNIQQALMEKDAIDEATRMAKMFEKSFMGQHTQVLNNYPGLSVPRPFAAFHPTIIKNRLIHLERELLAQIKLDEAREAQEKLESNREKMMKRPRPRTFTPFNFRIIG